MQHLRLVVWFLFDWCELLWRPKRSLNTSSSNRMDNEIMSNILVGMSTTRPISVYDMKLPLKQNDIGKGLNTRRLSYFSKSKNSIYRYGLWTVIFRLMMIEFFYLLGLSKHAVMLKYQWRGRYQDEPLIPTRRGMYRDEPVIATQSCPDMTECRHFISPDSCSYASNNKRDQPRVYQPALISTAICKVYYFRQLNSRCNIDEGGHFGEIIYIACITLEVYTSFLTLSLIGISWYDKFDIH